LIEKINMKTTSIFEKISASIINIVITFIIYLPFHYLINTVFYKKITLVIIFFLYNLIFLIFNKNKCLWMMIMKTKYEKNYPLKNKLLYIIFYTLSFASLFFSIYFPFDLFLANMIFLQLPIIITKKTTFHWYISWNIKTIK